MNDAPSSPISLVVSPIGKMRLQKFGDGCSTCSSILRAARVRLCRVGGAHDVFGVDAIEM
jgi:hypothetical protein